MSILILTIGDIALRYMLPIAVFVFGFLIMRDYGYATLLEWLGYVLIREARRSRDTQAGHAQALQQKIEHVREDL